MFSKFFSRQQVTTDEQQIEELLTRGVDEVIQKDSLRKKLLSGKRLRIKLGIDPTSPNLHLGRMVPLLKLRDFQNLGHDIVLIIGDGTGVIGDTSDKDSERPMLTEHDVRNNMRSYFTQAGMILDMSRVEKKCNSTWLHKLTYEEIGVHANQFSVADFIARDNIRRRLDAGKRVSLREVLYPLMQGYDSVAVRADVELGGVDQRFNLLAGRVLQEHFGQAPQDILMTPLIAGTDGRKMSSSWGNTINVTERPEDIYAKVMRVHDDLIPSYFTHLTRVSMTEVASIEEGLRAGTTHPRDAKMQLAHAIVTVLHSETVAQAAEHAFVQTFQKGDIPEDVQKVTYVDGVLLVDVLLQTHIVSSKSDFRRLVREGAITHKTSGERVGSEDVEATVGVYKIGKHRFIEIV